MKRPAWIRVAWVGTLCAGALILLAQWPVTTRVGVNYVWTAKRIPLYAKTINFLSRDLQTRQIATEAVAGAVTEEEKLLQIFSWVTSHIQATPAGFPLVDDHPLHVIIRGYGGQDQRTETFVLLAGYNGFQAVLTRVMPPPTTREVMFALVRCRRKTLLFDVVHRVVFRNERGELADLAELLQRPQLIARAAPGLIVGGLPYAQYVLAVPEERKIFSRTEAQQFWPRLKQELGRLFGFGRQPSPHWMRKAQDVGRACVRVASDEST